MGQYELCQFGNVHFKHITARKHREHAAEERLVEMFFGDRKDGVYVEVGANEPQYFSQTWHLEQAGWRGLLIEPIAELCDRLRSERPNSTVIQVAVSSPEQRGEAMFHVARHSGQSTLQRDQVNLDIEFDRTVTVQVRTLDDILAEANLPRLDFISIDVEGLQYEVLQGFSLAKHKPKLLFIEDHLLDLRTHRHITKQGYVLVKRTGLNNWYIPRGTPFELTCFGERIRLFRKVIAGTPLRQLRFKMKNALSRNS